MGWAELPDDENIKLTQRDVVGRIAGEAIRFTVGALS